MSKVEIAIFIFFVVAAVAGARYLGQLDGRLTAIEKSKSLTSLKEERLAAIALVEQSANASLKKMQEQERKGSAQFTQFDDRLKQVEAFIVRKRPALDEPIEAPGEAPWGLWKGPTFCPANHYVCGLEQKVEPTQGKGDDTATNGIRMYCCPL